LQIHPFTHQPNQSISNFNTLLKQLKLNNNPTIAMMVKLWQRAPGKALMFILNLFTAIALILEGYNQGVRSDCCY
jgi:hypothetical protein